MNPAQERLQLLSRRHFFKTTGLAAGRIHVSDHNCRFLAGKQKSGSTSNPRSAAGDDGYLVCKLHG